MEAFKTFREFWPFYLSQHSRPMTRTLHFIGIAIGLFFLLGAVLTRHPRFIFTALLFGYGFAWVSHVVFEKNRPATFKYPIYSFMGDFLMFFYMLTGRIDDEIKKQDVIYPEIVE